MHPPHDQNQLWRANISAAKAQECRHGGEEVHRKPTPSGSSPNCVLKKAAMRQLPQVMSGCRAEVAVKHLTSLAESSS